jgi:hypothetical protein
MLMPNFAARVRPLWPIAAALVLGLALVPLSKPTAITAPTVAIAVAPSMPDANAADLVGIYRSGACTLTLDAAGTYVTDCNRGHVEHYAIAGQQVVLGTQRLTISAPGRLVASDGTTYSIMEGTR